MGVSASPSQLVRHSAAAGLRRLLLLPVALCACNGESTAPAETLSQSFTSANYVYYMARGDVVDTTWQERYYTWIVASLALRPTARLEYHKYRDRAHLKELTGRDANGYADPGTVRFHTIWPTDNHEGVHALVSLYMGIPPALFTEGIAVAHQTDPLRNDFTPKWNGESLHAIARRFDTGGGLPASGSLLTSASFSAQDPEITYPVAGSFVRYLLDQYGLLRMKTFFAGSSAGDSDLRTVTRFIGAYGKTVDEAWTEWRAWLRR